MNLISASNPQMSVQNSRQYWRSCRLTDMPLTQIQAAVDRAQMTIIVGQTLVYIFKNLMKEGNRNPASDNRRSCRYGGAAKEVPQRLKEQIAIPVEWNLPGDTDEYVFI